MPALLSPESLADALRIPDLTAPREGPHALQLLVDAAVTAPADAWRCEVRTSRSRPIVSIEDNYERLRYSADAVTRDARYTRYVSETCVLRSHTSALIPPALRELAANPVEDVLLACPGLVYRRDSIDRLHSATPHQLDLWRVTQNDRRNDADLHAMVDLVLRATLPDRQWRWTPAEHPYTTSGRQIDVWYDGGWVEVGECGLAASAVLTGSGLHVSASGLALGIGLDRMLMIRKDLPDIRLLRSRDPRVSDQLRDLSPWRPVSRHPPVRRDISVAVSAGRTGEEIGDRVREALGPDSDSVEDVTLLSRTPYDELPQSAVDRLGVEEHQENVLVRIVLRDLYRTLTSTEANALRDRIWAAIDEGRQQRRYDAPLTSMTVPLANSASGEAR